MRAYLSTHAVGLNNMATIGGALDRAPRPYTAGELAEITGLDLYVVKAFLLRNSNRGKISVRDTPRPDGRCGPMVREYWRGQGSIWDTFAEGVGELDEETENKIISGARPVSWRGPSRTVWSLDELGTISTMSDRNVVRLGRVESAKATKTGITIRMEDGTALAFKRRKA